MSRHNSSENNTNIAEIASETLTFIRVGHEPLPDINYAPSDEALRIALNALHDSGLSWRQIAKIPIFEQNEIRAGTLCSVAKGANVPKIHRAALGLPRTDPAPVCPRHGIVHCYDCQSQTVRPRRTRARSWRSLWDIPTDELREMIENRQEI